MFALAVGFQGKLAAQGNCRVLPSWQICRSSHVVRFAALANFFALNWLECSIHPCTENDCKFYPILHVGAADYSVTLVLLIELRLNGLKQLRSHKFYCIVWLAHVPYMLLVSESVPSPETCYSEWGFMWFFLKFLQANSGTVAHVTPAKFPLHPSEFIFHAAVRHFFCPFHASSHSKRAVRFSVLRPYKLDK